MCRMSAFGTKRTSRPDQPMSAFGGKADIPSASLTPHEIKNSHVRMPVKNQIKFLSTVADKLSDQFLGIHLAENIELREMGLPYYVIASSETLLDALTRLARYSGLTNEGVRI